LNIVDRNEHVVQISFICPSSPEFSLLSVGMPDKPTMLDTVVYPEQKLLNVTLWLRQDRDMPQDWLVRSQISNWSPDTCVTMRPWV
jgi:hypothetical protein